MTTSALRTPDHAPARRLALVKPECDIAVQRAVAERRRVERRLAARPDRFAYLKRVYD